MKFLYPYPTIWMVDHNRTRLEFGLLVGALVAVLGFGLSAYNVWVWANGDFGHLDPATTLQSIIPATLCMTLGVQIVASSFFFGVLCLKRKLEH